MSPRWLRHIALPVAVVLLCLGLLVFGLVRLSAIEKTMRVSLASNMLWVMTQTEVEVLRLDATLARSLPGDPAISTRFDLLASRLDLIGEGPQARYLEDLGLAATLKAQADAVLAFDPRAAMLSAERIGALSDALFALRQSLHKAANRSMVAEWEELSLRLESYRGAVAQVISSLVLGLAVASFLGWRLVRDQRNLLRAEEVRLRSVRLEQELQQERTQGAYWRDFAAVVSHQFRTPLAVIDSAAQRILRRQGTMAREEQAQRLETIRGTVADLSRLVDAALLSGQIDNETRCADCARQDVVAPLRLLMRDLALRHPGRSLRIEAAVEPLRAWCDPGLVVHIVMNLLENALRHSSGAVVLRLFERGERVACAVVDLGPGIAAEEVSHIFERFRRGSSPGGDGSGIGLWTARRLAELQGGTLEVESWPGRGSVFTLWLSARAPVEEEA